jgi:hypothetical protein
LWSASALHSNLTPHKLARPGLGLVAVVLLTLAMTACGGSSKPQSKTEPPSTSEVNVSCCKDVSDSTKAIVARYSPVLMLAQDDFDPIEVESFFNEPGSRGEKPDSCLTQVTPRPASLGPGDCPTDATVLANNGQRSRLSVVGGDLNDPAAYASIYKSKVLPKYAAATYSEVKSADGIVSVDYWFFYLANFSIGNIDNHEGDWERIQVRIAAASVDDAARVNPLKDAAKVSFAYSRHRCDSTANMPVRAWGDVGHDDGTHPIVYVGNGSHANYFTAGNNGQQAATLVDGACFLGSTGDNTPAQRKVAPTPVLIDCADHLPAWTAFNGSWGVEGPRGPCQHR